MKNKNIYLVLVSMVLMISAFATQASASAIGDASIAGLPMGPVLLVVGIIFLLIAAFNWGTPLATILGVLGIVGLLIGGFTYVDMEQEQSTGYLLEDNDDDVEWTVEYDTDSDSNFDGNFSIDDDKNIISANIFVNSSNSTVPLRNRDNTSQFASSNPVFAFDISPTFANTEVIENSPQATGTVEVRDITFYEDGATRNIFENVSGRDEKHALWTEDSGATGYEKLNTIVSIGSNETITLTVNFNDGDLQKLDTGDSVSATIDVCGEIYTLTISVAYAY